MSQRTKYAVIRTKDISEIMELIRHKEVLSPVAYKRLHYYIVSLENMLQEALKTLKHSSKKIEITDFLIKHN